MNVKLPDDQTLWFRNLPPKESDEVSEEIQESAGKEPEVELFIEPLTGWQFLCLIKKATSDPLLQFFYCLVVMLISFINSQRTSFGL